MNKKRKNTDWQDVAFFALVFGTIILTGYATIHNLGDLSHHVKVERQNTFTQPYHERYGKDD